MRIGVRTPVDPSAKAEPHHQAAEKTRRLRVVHLAYTFYEADNRVIRYASAAAERGDDVEVFALRRPGQAGRADVGGVRVFRIQQRAKTERAATTYLVKTGWFLLQAAVLLTLRHLRKPYDVVHVHNLPDFLVFAALGVKCLGARVILDIHDILPELYAAKFAAERTSLPVRGLLWAERMSCRFADHVVVANHLWQERLIERAVPAEKCTTILNYPDLRIFRPAPAESRRRPGRFVILYPGSLSRHQGVDVAIRAVAKLKDRIAGAELHIYGDGPARSDLADLIARLEVGDRVVMFDPLPIGQIAAIMATADVGVEPKSAPGFANEALSTKILEFMACGVPVVASRTRIHQRYFDDSVVRFFTPGDPDDLADALAEVHDRRSESMSRVANGRRFSAAYSWQPRKPDYLRLVDSLSGRARSLLDRVIDNIGVVE